MKASPIRCLITAGPTREYFDPVRFLSNPSTGKMGFALAAAAREVGWEVHLVSGPTFLDAPEGVSIERVETGEEMFAAAQEVWPHMDVLIATAAVMDYRPRERLPEKVKKDKLSMTIDMLPTQDILKTLAADKGGRLVVGFAAETEDIEANGRSKMERKNCDLLVANRVGEAGAGFASDSNEVILLDRWGGAEPLGPMSKLELARVLVARFAAVRAQAEAQA